MKHTVQWETAELVYYTSFLNSLNKNAHLHDNPTAYYIKEEVQND
jgi:hypothetical protein